MYKSPTTILYLTLVIFSISILACSQPAATKPTSTIPEAKETTTAKPESLPQATPRPLATNVFKPNSTNPEHSTINDKTTITCDLDIPKQFLVCKAYPIPNDSNVKWSSTIGGWSNSNSYELKLEREYQFNKEASIQLQLCQNSTCETTEVNIDTYVAKPITKNTSHSDSKDPKTNQTINTSENQQSSANSNLDLGDTVQNNIEISCDLDENQKKILCESNVFNDDGEITWSSNIAGWTHS